MPSERFFYRPVPPNWEAIGAGIGGGIETGVGGYLDEKDRSSERQRQEEADRRKRMEENVWLATMGGGRGEQPDQNLPPLDFGRPGLAARGPGNVLTRDVNLAPQVGPVQQVAGQPPIRQYVDIGEPGYEAYIENPESAAKRRQMEEMALARRSSMDAQSAERLQQELRVGQAGRAMAQIKPGMTPEQGAAYGTMMEQGYGDYSDFFPEAKGEGLPDFEEATAFVNETFGIFEEDEFGQQRMIGSKLSPSQRLQAIRGIATGKPTGLPELDNVRGYGELNQELMGEMFGSFDRPMAPRSVVPMDPEYVQTILQELSKYPRSQWEAILSQPGDDGKPLYSPDEISAILGR